MSRQGCRRIHPPGRRRGVAGERSLGRGRHPRHPVCGRPVSRVDLGNGRHRGARAAAQHPSEHRQHRRRGHPHARRAVQVHAAGGRTEGRARPAAADPEREKEQIQRLRALAEESHLDPAFAEKFLNFIVAEVIHHHERIASRTKSAGSEPRWAGTRRALPDADGRTVVITGANAGSATSPRNSSPGRAPTSCSACRNREARGGRRLGHPPPGARAPTSRRCRSTSPTSIGRAAA